MVKIRLQRSGAKNKPKYRVVIVEEREKRNGAVIETIGTYDPTTDPPKVEIKKERFELWSSRGAQPTDAVRHLIKRYERVNRVPS
jgi:small subunit ribosomal protein S16